MIKFGKKYNKYFVRKVYIDSVKYFKQPIK